MREYHADLGGLITSSKARCSALPAMASWSCSTIRCHVSILRCAPLGSPSPCATTLPRLRPTGASWVTSSGSGSASPTATPRSAASVARAVRRSRPNGSVVISPRPTGRRGEKRNPDRQQVFAAIEELAETEPVGGFVLRVFTVRSKPSIEWCELHRKRAFAARRARGRNDVTEREDAL